MTHQFDPLLCAFSQFVTDVTGLAYPTVRLPDLLQAVRRMAEKRGDDSVRACMQALMSAGGPQADVDIMAACLSTGETYFFRDQGMFDFLQQEILPTLLTARRACGERRLRIWSAGCCTGEEAFSLAIMLQQLIPDQVQWQVDIIGTDLNPEFLRRATAGIYQEWSFRHVPQSVKQRYFSHDGNGNYTVIPSIKRRVKFRTLNLALHEYPPEYAGFDLILCRNVLMYFNAQQFQAVVGKLHNTLAEGGWLTVSSAECGGENFAAFTAVPFDSGILYRKDAPKPAPINAGGRDDASKGIIISPQKTTDHAPATDPERQLSMARNCADCGDLLAAAHYAEAAILADKCDPRSRYLMANIFQEKGEVDNAIVALQQALFLDQRFALAHFALSGLYRRKNLHREAERHARAALDILLRTPSEEVILESDGLTAGKLIHLIKGKQQHA